MESVCTQGSRFSVFYLHRAHAGGDSGAHARASGGDVIEPAALRRNVAYREFFNSIKFRVK